MKIYTSLDLKADIAALRAVTEAELRNLNTRLCEVELTQKELVRVATQGKTGLRILLWLGGGMIAMLTFLGALWKDFLGR